jgi:hypothetical protein
MNTRMKVLCKKVFPGTRKNRSPDARRFIKIKRDNSLFFESLYSGKN